jgi:hypothetical protein
MTDKLHRIHAVPSKGHSLDIGATRWRPADGGTRDEKASQARRLAVCWNVCEGWPTEALEEGVLSMTEGCIRELLVAIDALPGETVVHTIAHALRYLREKQAAALDTTGGRLHDCPSCLGQSLDQGVVDGGGADDGADE